MRCPLATGATRSASDRISVTSPVRCHRKLWKTLKGESSACEIPQADLTLAKSHKLPRASNRRNGLAVKDHLFCRRLARGMPIPRLA
jgi:hypothetical protein